MLDTETGELVKLPSALEGHPRKLGRDDSGPSPC